MYTVKEKGGNLIRKPYPLPYGLRNPYRNLKSENSQDYAQKSSAKLYVHEFGVRVKAAVLTWPVCGRSIRFQTGGQAQRRGRQPDQTAEADGRCTSRPARKTCVHFVHNFTSFEQHVLYMYL
jgi:hypothetical protein